MEVVAFQALINKTREIKETRCSTVYLSLGDSPLKQRRLTSRMN